jgi:hypothetical protein
VSKKFKRYYTGQTGEPGKGDWTRSAQVSAEQVAKNHCATFGHFIRHGFCTSCYLTETQISNEVRPA